MIRTFTRAMIWNSQKTERVFHCCSYRDCRNNKVSTDTIEWGNNNWKSSYRHHSFRSFGPLVALAVFGGIWRFITFAQFARTKSGSREFLYPNQKRHQQHNYQFDQKNNHVVAVLSDIGQQERSSLHLFRVRRERSKWQWRNVAARCGCLWVFWGRRRQCCKRWIHPKTAIDSTRDDAPLRHWSNRRVAGIAPKSNLETIPTRESLDRKSLSNGRIRCKKCMPPIYRYSWVLLLCGWKYATF